MKSGLPVAYFPVGAIYLPVIGSDAERPLVVLEKFSSNHCREFNAPDSKPCLIPKDEHGFEVITYVLSELHEGWLFTPVLEGRIVITLDNLYRKSDGKAMLLNQAKGNNPTPDLQPSAIIVSPGHSGIVILEKDGRRYPMVFVDWQ
jgi:hypothetical protein